MFQNALRRVISNPDISMNEVHDESQVEPVEQEPARDRIVVMENMPDATAENSMPFTLIHSRSNSSSAMMSSSTLSEDDHHEQTQQELMDEAVADEVNDDNDENNDQPDRPRHRMRRMDSEEVSRVSSQNSSRDWGWFEDVHQQATGKSSKRRPSQREEDSMIMQRMQNIMRDMDPEGKKRVCGCMFLSCLSNMRSCISPSLFKLIYKRSRSCCHGCNRTHLRIRRVSCQSTLVEDDCRSATASAHGRASLLRTHVGAKLSKVPSILWHAVGCPDGSVALVLESVDGWQLFVGS
jgi:hypothetical protein